MELLLGNLSGGISVLTLIGLFIYLKGEFKNINTKLDHLTKTIDKHDDRIIHLERSK